MTKFSKKTFFFFLSNLKNKNEKSYEWSTSRAIEGGQDHPWMAPKVVAATSDGNQGWSLHPQCMLSMASHPLGWLPIQPFKKKMSFRKLEIK
jgi:hypothetical protein